MAFCTIYCPYCHKMLEEQENRHTHLANHYVESQSCWVVGCDDLLPPGLLYAHVKHFRDEHPFTPTLTSAIKPKKYFQCGVCNKAFSARSTVKYYHANNHTGETPFFCKKGCGAHFGDRNKKLHHETHVCQFRYQTVDDESDEDRPLVPSTACSSLSSMTLTMPVLSVNTIQHTIIYRLVYFIQLTQKLPNLPDPQGQLHTFLMEELLRRRENTYQNSNQAINDHYFDLSIILEKYQPEYQPFALYTHNDDPAKDLFYTLDIPNYWRPAPDAYYEYTQDPTTDEQKSQLNISKLESSEHDKNRHEMLLNNITFNDLNVDYFKTRGKKELHRDHTIRRGILIFAIQGDNYRYINFFMDEFERSHYLYLIDTKNKKIYLHATAADLKQFNDDINHWCYNNNIANVFSIESIDNLRSQVREDQIGLLSTVSPVECQPSCTEIELAAELQDIHAAELLTKLKRHGSEPPRKRRRFT